jgi:hypothetical protein
MRNAEGVRCYLLSASSVAVFNRSGSRHACTKNKVPPSVVRSRRTMPIRHLRSSLASRFLRLRSAMSLWCGKGSPLLDAH